MDLGCPALANEIPQADTSSARALRLNGFECCPGISQTCPDLELAEPGSQRMRVQRHHGQHHQPSDAGQRNVVGFDESIPTTQATAQNKVRVMARRFVPSLICALAGSGLARPHVERRPEGELALMLACCDYLRAV